MKLTLQHYISLAIMTLFLVHADNSIAQSTPADHAKHHPPKTDAASPGPLDSLQKTLDKNADQMGVKKNPAKKPAKKAGSKSKDAKMPMNSSGGMTDMMGMMGPMMGQMPSNQGSGQSAELPGFPGSSHIYHMGAKGFFLDYSGTIDLSSEQTSRLEKIKDRAQQSQASFNQKIKKAEEELWLLTASDRPDIKSIEAKVKAIEALRGEKRINFIRDVGEAAGVLSEEQRTVLLRQKQENQDADMEDM